jgi:hypothetical protein
VKKVLIGLAAVLVLCGGAAAYLIIDHNNDVAHAKAVKAAREARIDREYKKNLAAWRADDADWQRKNSDYQECQTATSDAFDAGDDLSGVIGSGGSRDDFMEPEQELSAEISRATRAASGTIACLGVLLNLSKAHDAAGDGLNIWLEWMRGDSYLSAESPDDLPMAKHLGKAQDYLTDANDSLSAMKPGEEPVKPDRGEDYVPPDDLTPLDDEDAGQQDS